MSTRNKLPEAALEFFRKKGRMGGRQRAANLPPNSAANKPAKPCRPDGRNKQRKPAKRKARNDTRTAVLYARVSSREQQEEGYSIEAQVKLLHTVASEKGLEIAREFVDVESAKTTGRKLFAEMVTYFKRNRSCRTLLVEKTDRLYRNFRDAVTLEDLDLEIHFVKEGQVLSKDSKSQTKLMHDIRLAIARNYSENLREEVKKGMSEKASQGIYPGRPPFGYRNNQGARTIETHPEKGATAVQIFEWYATGRYSLLGLAKELRYRSGTRISKTNLHKMLTNPFYIGRFEWGGQTYSGTHRPLISPGLFAQAQAVLHGGTAPKYGKHDIAFRGLLKCAHDNCTVTAELKKGKYVYYRCSGYRGKCALPRFREQEIAEKLGYILKDVQVPEEVARSIEASLQRVARADAGRRGAGRGAPGARTNGAPRADGRGLHGQT